MALCGVVLAVGLISCSDPAEAPGKTPQTRSQTAAAPVELLASPEERAFLDRLSSAFQSGDAKAVDETFYWEGTPTGFMRFVQGQLLPKGPMLVTSARLEALAPGEEIGLDFRGVKYVPNIDIKGRVVIELKDVSVGEIVVNQPYGVRNGELYLSGLVPQG